MPRRKILFLSCLAAAVASLAIGLALAGQWLAALATLLPAAAMLAAGISPKRQHAWLAPVALVLFIALAVSGILLDAPPFWMLCGAIFALACWDLALWSHAVQGSFSAQVQRLENKHFRSLLWVVILGGLVVAARQFLRLQVSFWVILPLVLAVFYGLDKVFRQFEF